MNFSEFVRDLPTVAAGIVLFDFLRYFVTASVVYGLVWWIFPRQLATRRIFPDDPKRGQMVREFGHSMSTVLVFAASGLFIYSMQAFGHTRIYAQVADHGWVWWWTSLLFIVLAHDTWFYWTHRLLHRPWWFARFHSIHHRSVHPTPWAAYSFHPVEALLQSLFFVLMVHTVPMHGAVLFVFLSWMIVRNVVGHCAYELLPWGAATTGWLRWLTSNSHHHFHHAMARGNFGLYFTWWDRWMATEDIRYIDHGNSRFRADPDTAVGREVT